MNKMWQEFIDTQGVTAEIGEDEQASIADLSWRSQILISGTDATEFLHGQFSNDLKALDGSNQQLSSYSTPKGRILALFRIARINKDYLLDCPSEVAGAFIKRLSMFVMRSDVAIKNIDDERAMLGICGKPARQILQSAVPDLPESDGICHNPDSGVLVASNPGLVPRYTVSAPTETLQKIWIELINAGAQAVTANYWRLGAIEAGQPEIYSATSESFVAQMINLQLINGVNFKKGCYPGQEVIARLQYLGKLKRKMYLLEYDSDGSVSAGDPVFANDNKEPAGEVVDAAKTATDKTRLLAVLKTAPVESGSVLSVNDSDVAPLKMLDLPYSLADA